MGNIKTHTFNGKKRKICFATKIYGLCEDDQLTILRGNSVDALGSALEEGLHAMDIPDHYLHKPDSEVPIGKSQSKVDDLARFLWRLGWRKK